MRARWLILALLLVLTGGMASAAARYTVFNALATFVGANNALTEVSSSTPLPVSIVQTLGGSSSTGTLCAVANVNTTVVGNTADTNEDNLMSYTLPASTLNQNGRFVRIRAWGTYAANGDNKTLKFYFGTSTTLASAATNNARWQVSITVTRTGSSTQEGEFFILDSSGIGNLNINNFQPNQTDTASITIKLTGQASVGNANDITQRGMLVEVCN